jgi:hypothetical protein
MDAMTRLTALGKRLREEHDLLLARRAPALGPIRDQLARLPAPAAAPRRWQRYALGGAAGALAAGLALLLTRSSSAPALECYVNSARLDAPIGAWVAAETKPALLRFSDGTRSRLDPSSRARIVALNAHGAHLVLESGRAELAVVPLSAADWKVSTGPFLVEVTGTRFDLSWSPDQDRFELTLHEGQVRVSGCVFGPGRLVKPGETVRASCRKGTSEIIAAEDRDRSPAGPVSDTTAHAAPPPLATAAAAAPAVPVSPAPGSGWAELARRGAYGEAFALVGPSFRTECERGSAREVMLLGDVARFAGKPEQARQAYLALRRRFAGSASAGLAAFALARVAFDQQANYGESARWLRTYLAEQPGGKFAREAQGRLMEAVHRLGDRTAARAAATSYLQRYPEGPHSQLARALTARQK